MTSGAAARSREQMPLLARFPRLARRTPVVSLSAGPSPVASLGRLSDSLAGTDVWLKNDGLYGTTYGGNGTTTFALPDLRSVAPNGLTYKICDQGIFPSLR